MSRCGRQGRVFSAPVVGAAGFVGVAWLGGFAAASGIGVPLWAVVAASAVVGGVAGIGSLLIKFSHGGDWTRPGRVSRNGGQSAEDRRGQSGTRASGANPPYRRTAEWQAFNDRRETARGEVASWR